MGSYVSKCYTGGCCCGGGGGDGDPGAVKEKHVVICQSSPPRPAKEASVVASPSSSFSSTASFSPPPPTPNPSASPTSSSFSFSSTSANCSSCPPTPPRWPSKKVPRAARPQLDAEKPAPARRAARRACSCSPAARAGRQGSAAVAPAGRRTVRSSAPKLRRSRSSVGGFGEMEAAGKMRNAAARPAAGSRRKVRYAVQSIEQGQQGGGVQGGSACQSSVAPLVEDLNNPLISMDCFIFL